MFIINIDGVNKYLFFRVGYLWLVYIMINEFLKEYWFKKKFIIFVYIYCDKYDLNMLIFFNFLVEKLNVLNLSGIYVLDSVDGDINVWCMLFVVIVDLFVWVDLMNMKCYNGKCVCYFCKLEGVGYGLNNIYRYWFFEKSFEKRIYED